MTLSIRSILATSIVLAGCASHGRAPQDEPFVGQSDACTEPYVQIANGSKSPLEIYGYVNGGPILLGRVNANETRLSLLGTPLERDSAAVFYATAGGTRVSTTPGTSHNGSVTLTRRCGRR